MNLIASVSPRRVVQALLFVALFLILVSAVAQLTQIKLGLGRTGFLPVFFVGKDDSIPELYSSLLLLLCSVLLAVIAHLTRMSGNRFFLRWLILSAIFLYLSVDEGFSIHEKMGPLGERMLEGASLSDGFIIRAWVVPGAILVILVALTYVRFVVALPRKIRYLFFLAGFLYVGGALGMEILHDFYVNLYGSVANMSLGQTAIRIALIYVEEALEMLGIIIFIYSLMLYVDATSTKEARLRAGS